MTYIDETDLGEFLEGYRDAMLWANTVEYGDGDLAGDGAAEGEMGPALCAEDADIESTTWVDAEAECTAFLESITEDSVLPVSDDGAILWPRGGYGPGAYGARAAGSDFALTRNGHGTGFWDRGLGDVGDVLTDMAKAYGEATWLLVDGVATAL